MHFSVLLTDLTRVFGHTIPIWVVVWAIVVFTDNIKQEWVSQFQPFQLTLKVMEVWMARLGQIA